MMPLFMLSLVVVGSQQYVGQLWATQFFDDQAEAGIWLDLPQ